MNGNNLGWKKALKNLRFRVFKNLKASKFQIRILGFFYFLVKFYDDRI